MIQTALKFHTHSVSRRGFLLQSIATISITAGLDAAEPGATTTNMNPRLHTFIGGNNGQWAVTLCKAVIGEALPLVKRLDIVNRNVTAMPDGAQWMLHGATSNVRYATREEKDQLSAKQAELGRPEATHAALIPIRKNAAWWALTQDERRAIFEDRSKHTAIGLKYLPAIARRLHHCRDLSESEPFDFLTLFDCSKSDSAAFEDLVAALRATEEWKFVDREIDIRMVRD